MKDLDYDQRRSIKIINNAEDFLNNIEKTFGSYKDGMREIIKGKLRQMTRENLVILFNEILDRWGFQRPPEYKYIADYAYEKGISLGQGSRKKEYHLVCRKCKRRRPLDAMRCPECNTINNVFVARGKLEPGNLFYEGEE